MATYRGIKGFTMQSLASDPAANTNTEGQVWYNTTTKILKGIAGAAGGGVWASASNVNQARQATGGSKGGTQTATMIFGGGADAPLGQTNLTEEFDGTSWAVETALNTARAAGGGFGTTADALYACGVTDTSYMISTNAVESWNGSTWTETTGMGTPRFSGFNAGIATAGIIAGGLSRPGAPPGAPIGYKLNTETWNGSAWSETGDLNLGRYDGGGTGTTTSMLAVGGNGFPSAPLTHDTVESFDGTSWTEVNAINTARAKATGAGDTTGALMAGGTPAPANALTEEYDGTSWAEVADLATGRAARDSGAGSITAMIIAAGGPNDAALAATEEWNIASPSWSVKTFTAS